MITDRLKPVVQKLLLKVIPVLFIEITVLYFQKEREAREDTVHMMADISHEKESTQLCFAAWYKRRLK